MAHEIDAPVREFSILCLACGSGDVTATRGRALIVYVCRACGATASAAPGELP